MIMLYRDFMRTSSREIMKSVKKLRAPKTGEPILVRLQDQPLAQLDNWRRAQPDLPGRAEAVRRLLETHPEIKKGKPR
jgi:hypothetical protein